MNETQVIAAFQQVAETLRQNSAQQLEGLTSVVRQVAEQGQVMKGLMEQNAQFLQAETESRKKECFIDTKAVGKPPLFSGKEADWPGWQFKFGTWIAGQFEKGDEILDWAAGSGEQEVSEVKIDEVVSKYPRIKALNNQLHAVLVSLMTMGTTSFDIAKNTRRSM